MGFLRGFGIIPKLDDTSIIIWVTRHRQKANYKMGGNVIKL